jgi:hypothetical protein
MIYPKAIALGLASAAIGCAYAHGSIDYVAAPELRNVRLYTGRPEPLGENLPAVAAEAVGRGDCSTIAAEAVRSQYSS